MTPAKKMSIKQISDETLSADQLVDKGLELRRRGHDVAFLYPSQEWMAVQTQVPFLRYGKVPTDGDGARKPAAGKRDIKALALHTAEKEAACLEKTK